MSTIQIAIPALITVNSLLPDYHYGYLIYVGQTYASGSKANNHRTIFRADLSSLAGWTDLTAAKLVGNVTNKTGAAFAATLRQVTEEFTYTEVTYNHRTTADSWATAGADTPNSATDTNKIAFTSPAATGLQDLVTGMLTLVNLVGTGILRFHIRSDNESPGVDTSFTCYATWYLEVDGTAPASTFVQTGMF